MPICMQPSDIAWLALVAAAAGATAVIAVAALWDRITEGPLPPEDSTHG